MACSIETLSRQYEALCKVEKDSKVPVPLAMLTEETRCPVCFGILRNTRVSTVCLHRFCATCIDTCLAGRPPQHKDCPVCRANLHSRRSLRPDRNFDLLLKALYGDVALYGQQEDALVAAHNAAHAHDNPEEEERRRKVRAAQRAAREASHRGGLAAAGAANGGAKGASQRSACGSGLAAAAAAAAADLARTRSGSAASGPAAGNDGACRATRQQSSSVSNGNGNGTGGIGGKGGSTCQAGGKRGREGTGRGRAPIAADGDSDMEDVEVEEGEEEGGEEARGGGRGGRGHGGGGSCGRGRGAKRHHSVPPLAEHQEKQLQQQASPHGRCGLTHHLPAHVPGSLPRHASSPLASPQPVASPSVRGGSTCRTDSDASARAVDTKAAAAAAAVAHASGGGAGGVRAPHGPLAAVPCGRSASELLGGRQLRHPGLVLVQLLPAQDAPGGGGGGGAGGAGADAPCNPGGRPVRCVAPRLDKPFVLCPAKWTVAHVAQLLSQKLPPRGYAPAACPTPPESIRLEPPAGLLRGSHRCAGGGLRGCTQLGSLAAELGQGQGQGPAGGGGSGDHGHLVLLYHVAPAAAC